MGAAAHRRGDRAIAADIARERSSPEFAMMDDLNSIPKEAGAPIPFGPIVFSIGHGGWWATCPVTGFGFWYPTLRKAVAAWGVTVVSVDAKGWRAVPFPTAFPRA